MTKQEAFQNIVNCLEAAQAGQRLTLTQVHALVASLELIGKELFPQQALPPVQAAEAA